MYFIHNYSSIHFYLLALKVFSNLLFSLWTLERARVCNTEGFMVPLEMYFIRLIFLVHFLTRNSNILSYAKLQKIYHGSRSINFNCGHQIDHHPFYYFPPFPGSSINNGWGKGITVPSAIHKRGTVVHCYFTLCHCGFESFQWVRLLYPIVLLQNAWMWTWEQINSVYKKRFSCNMVLFGITMFMLLVQVTCQSCLSSMLD